VLMATQLLSQGTPMILMGDEIGRSQGGNNNAYCQDHELSWMEWDGMGERDRAFYDFVEGLLRVRRTWPALRQVRFMHGQTVGDSDIENVIWLRPDGERMSDEAWSDPIAKSIALLLCAPDLQRMIILMNAHHEDVAFRLP